MARIRTIKPDFFRHEKLQDLEEKHLEMRPMLVFCGLWGHCDKQGVFEWRPRQLALDILPFVWRGNIGETLEKTLLLLAENGLITRMEYDGKLYGYIPTFTEHQRITGKEAVDKAKNPQVSKMTLVIDAIDNNGNIGETLGKHPGNIGDDRKGKEGNGMDIKEKQEKEKEPSAPVGLKSDSVYQVIEYLNQKTGKTYSTKSKANVDIITARFREGFSVDDCKLAIDNQVREWGNDGEMMKYLRPATLFRASKFEGYLNNTAKTASEQVEEQLSQEEIERRARKRAQFEATMREAGLE